MWLPVRLIGCAWPDSPHCSYWPDQNWLKPDLSSLIKDQKFWGKFFCNIFENYVDIYHIMKYFENIASQGSIVFESDMDCHSMVILDGYDNRWSLESVFNNFKNTLDLDITNVHEKSSIIGNEFINYLTVLITCRIGKAFKAVDAKFKSTPGYSLKAKIADLSDIDRDADAPLIGSLYDGCWNLPAKNSSMILLGRLGLIEDYPEGK